MGGGGLLQAVGGTNEVICICLYSLYNGADSYTFQPDVSFVASDTGDDV